MQTRSPLIREMAVQVPDSIIWGSDWPHMMLFCAWALGSMKPDSVERVVDWCTKAKSDMPPRKSALELGKDAYHTGFLKTWTDDIYPSARAEPRMPPQVYKAISDAIQNCQLNNQKPEEAAAAASTQIDAFLASYKGAPIL